MAGDPLIGAVTILLAAAGVTALVGTNVTPLIRTQDVAVPAVTISPIATVPQNHMSGDGGLDNTRLQVDSWGATYSDARTLANAVRAAFLAANVLMTVDHPTFEEQPIPGVYRVTQEFLFWS